MKPRLLELMCCPACHGALELSIGDRSGEEIIEGTLACESCGHAYPVARGVPRFVADDQYAGNFSHEWTVHRRTQLDSATGRTGSRDAFDEKCGFSEDQLRGALVLDVGCGTGRFAEIAADRGAEVVGMDLSFAVDSAFENLGHRENVHIVQASVFEMPFRPATFAAAYSLGVLHHTPSTRDAFRAMLPVVRDGGDLAIWVYWSRMSGVVASDAIRFFTTRMSDEALYARCQRVVPWINDPKRGRLVRRIFGRHVLVSHSDDPQEAVLDTFDWYSPKYQWKHDWPEVERWFAEAGLVDIRRNDFPVAVRGRKPPSRP